MKSPQPNSPMKKFSVLLLLTCLAFLGCQTFPLGLTEAQWKALSPEQQADYQRQQSLLDEQRRLEREAAERTRQAEAAARAQQEQARIQLAYAHARYGDIVTVTIEGGLVAFSGRHQPYEPLRFDLVRGERREIEFVQQGRASNRTRADVRLTDDGNTFYLDESAQDRIALLSTGWDAGKTHSAKSVSDRGSRTQARALNITLKWKSLPGHPRR